MKITTRGRFAVNAMMHIVMNKDHVPISITEIAEHQNISVAYLEQIFCKLRRAGLVKSVRGPGGGYYLGQDGESITVLSIINAVDEDLDPRQCRGHEGCKGDGNCLTHALWDSLNTLTQDYLESVTLRAIRLGLQRRTINLPRKMEASRKSENA